jgi:hypothetical protein
MDSEENEKVKNISEKKENEEKKRRKFPSTTKQKFRLL